MMSEILKQISKNSFIYSLAGIIGRIISFFMIPIYTQYLNPEDYGIVEIIDITTYIFGMIIGSGMVSSILRFYHEYDDEMQSRQFVSTALIFIFFLEIFSLGITYYFSNEIALFTFGSDKYALYFRIVFINLHINILSELALAYIRAKREAIRFMILTLARVALGLLLNVYLIVFVHLGIWGVLYGSLISSGINVIVLIILTITEVKICFSLDKLKEMLRYGIPLIPASVGMFVLTFADRFFLQKYATLSAVGVYSLGYKGGMIINGFLTTPFLLFWSSYMYEIDNKKNAKELFAKIQGYFSFSLMLSALILSLFSDIFVRFVSPPAYWEASKIIPIIAFSYVALGFNYSFHTGIQIKKETKYIAYSSGVGAILNILLNYALIPSYYEWGASLATFLSFSSMAIGNFMASQYLYPIRFEYERLFKMFISILIIFFLSRLITFFSIIQEIIVDIFLLSSLPFILWTMSFYRDNEIKILKRWIKIFVMR